MAPSRVSKRSVARSAPPKRFGSERPRVFTPPLRRLEPRSPATEKRTEGYSVIDFALKVLGVHLYPWQKWLLIHALELLPDCSFRFRNVIVLVARQNGKSTLSQVLALWFMYVFAVDLVIGTAQDLDVAEEIWQGAVDFVEETPELEALRLRTVKNSGRKSLDLKTGARYKVKAANRRAGRSLSGDLILLDELREHQSWDAWGAVTKTTMARPDAQVWALSNAGDAASIVLRYLRKMAHAAIGDPDGINAADDPASLLPVEDDFLERVDGDESEPEDVEIDDDSLFIAEWSAPPGCAVTDRDGWYMANPTLGHGGITERTIASACRTDPEWIFRTEVLCQWSDGSIEGPFPPGTWEAGTVRPPALPAIVGKVKACVDVSHDRSRAHVSFAGINDRGRAQVEIVASRAGVDWVLPWMQDPKRVDLIDAVTGQTRGAPVSGLLVTLAAAGVPIVDWQGPDLGAGSGAFYDLVRDNGFDHLPQPVLDVAAATAVTKPSGDGWLWDRRHSPTDIAPLIAANGAMWLLNRPAEVEFVSAYASGGVEVI